MTEPAKNISEAITRVMTKVDYVQKEKTGALKYSFAGEAALIAALRPEMVEEGISMYCAGIEDVVATEYQSSSGTRMINVTLTGHWAFVHAPSGTQIVVTSRGEGSDSSDKANNKAMTGSFKYAIRQTFMIETGDDPDKDQNDERKSASRQVSKPKAEPAAKQMAGIPEKTIDLKGWHPSQVEAAMKTVLLNGTPAFASQYEFINAVAHSKVMKPGVIPTPGLVYWIQEYKKSRIIEGQTPEASADIADNAYLAEKARKAQDEATEKASFV